VVIETPDIKFDDIGGLEEVKMELREMVAAPTTNAPFYADMGLSAPRGALLYGPPGCGKTLLAKAMACECEANFISIKGWFVWFDTLLFISIDCSPTSSSSSPPSLSLPLSRSLSLSRHPSHLPPPPPFVHHRPPASLEVGWRVIGQRPRVLRKSAPSIAVHHVLR
jgi:hypothetical protein